jgi:hypothetical protein
MAKQKMANMTGYSNGYTPPKGNAGAAAKGNYSHNRNPMGVPRKGSSIDGDMGYGYNSDRGKVMSMKKSQAMNENLRGQAGC